MFSQKYEGRPPYSARRRVVQSRVFGRKPARRGAWRKRRPSGGIEVSRHTLLLGLVLLYRAAFASGFGGLDTRADDVPPSLRANRLWNALVDHHEAHSHGRTEHGTHGAWSDRSSPADLPALRRFRPRLRLDLAGGHVPRCAPICAWGGLLLVSVVLTAVVLREFRRADTHFDARKPVTALLTRGPFRFSRNPVKPLTTTM